MKKHISVLLTILFLCLFVYYFIVNIEDFASILDINLFTISIVALLSASTIIINGIFMKIAIRLFDKSISVSESIRVSLISTAGNFFAPAGSGLGIRAVYLKKKHQLSYRDYISIVLCNYIVVFIIIALFGLLSLFMLREFSGELSYRILLYLMIGIIGASLLSVFLRNIKLSSREGAQNKYLRYVNTTLSQIQKGWSLLWSDKKTIIYFIGLTIINTLIAIIIAYIITSSLGIQMTLGGLILYSVLGSLSVFINVTPGNLGIKEAVYIATSSIIGLSSSEILAIAVVDRTIIFAVLFILWAIYARSSKKSKDLTAS